MVNEIAQRLAAVERAIEQACAESNRPRDSVRLIGVSKFHAAETIESAFEAGLRHFGENYAQELALKQEKLRHLEPELSWHFTGRVQRNKSKLLRNTCAVHGVGSLGQLSALTQAGGNSMFLLQVNLAGEGQKNGFLPDELRATFSDLRAIAGERLAGLMLLPPASATPSERQRAFAELRGLRSELEHAAACRLPELSMGMSDDFSSAIREGATWIRVGTAIFGPRPSASPPDAAVVS